MGDVKTVRLEIRVRAIRLSGQDDVAVAAALQGLIARCAGELALDPNRTIEVGGIAIADAPPDAESLRALRGWATANGVTAEELDELVHDLKSGEASAINNAGLDAQLAFLLRCHDSDPGRTWQAIRP
jgi:hypothetical protein